MAFKPNDQSYGHIHGIVCSNDLILCTRVHLGIPNNFPKGVFIFFSRKIHFPFSECPKWVFLWRTCHIFVAKLDQINFLKYYAIFNAQLTKCLGVQSFLIHLWWKRQISVDSVGSGSNLNCSCYIVCSLFFPKIISSYINTYLIINTWFGGDTSRFGCGPGPQLQSA